MNSDENNSHPGFQRQPSRKLSHTGTSLYELLGIDRGSTSDDIRKAYRKLALRNHPDKNPNDPQAADRFKEINQANSILSDPNKRAIYDQYGSVGIQLMDRIGQDNLRVYMALNNPCVKCCLLFTFCITGCCCCLCCCCCFNFCCGRCAPADTGEDDNFFREDSMDATETVTTQPKPSSVGEGTPLSSPDGAGMQPPPYSG